jgi:membrane-associated protease RseP (regulator of RpoE activity)
LGVVTDDRQEKGAGVRVVELQSGGPADIGGLRSGDLITSLNGTAVHNQTDMLPLLQKLAPNSKVTFGVDRGGQQQTIAVTLGTRPPTGQRRYEKFGQIPDPQPEPATGGGIGSETPVGPLPDTLPPGNPTPANEPGRFPADVLPGGAPLPGGPSNGSAPNGLPNLAGPDSGIQLGTRALPTVAPSRRPLLGVRTRPLTGEIQRRLRLPSTQGALVVARTLGSPAAVAGIPLDAVITAVDGKAVGLPQDLTALIGQAGPGREVEITYFYEGSEQHAKVKLAEVALGSSGLLGGSPISAGPVPAPPAPQANQLPVPDDKTRIDALERRVQQLEHRVDDLEQSLRRLK